MPRPVALAALALAVQGVLLAMALACFAPLAAVALAVGCLAGLVAFRAGNPLACHGGLLFSVAALFGVLALTGRPALPAASAVALLVFVACIAGRGSRAHFGLTCPGCGSTRVVGENFFYRHARCRSCGGRWPVAERGRFAEASGRVPGPRPASARPPESVLLVAGAIGVEGGALAVAYAAAAPFVAVACAAVGLACAVNLVRGRPFAWQAAAFLAVAGVVFMTPLLSYGGLLDGVEARWFGFVSVPALLSILPMLLSRDARVYFGLVCPACRSKRVSGRDFWFRWARCQRCAAVWVPADTRPGAEVFD